MLAEITDNGRRLVERATSELIGHRHLGLGVLSEEDCVDLFELLKRVRSSARRT